MISARENLLGAFSGTIEHLSRYEHSVTCEDGWGVSECVGLEHGSICGEPPRLDEATGVFHPIRCSDFALTREELGCPGQSSVKARIARAGWLLANEQNLPGARRPSEIVSETEQQA